MLYWLKLTFITTDMEVGKAKLGFGVFLQALQKALADTEKAWKIISVQ